jgi:hypothetical protein
VLAENPGARPVQLLFERSGGEPLRVDVGNEFRIDLTPELEEKLAPWLASKSELLASSMAAPIAM